jgi:hypothetical protein
MFDFSLSGLFTGPVEAVERVTDEKLKRDLEHKSLSLGFSQYMTFLESFGQEFKDSKWFGRWARIARQMAASFFVGLSLENDMKILDVAVPNTLSNDKKLLGSVYWEEFKNPKGV